jgi:hypothetical protein
MSRGQPGPAPNDTERIVADAWHRVLELIDRLNEQPIDRGTSRELRPYLASDACDAVEAYERVTAEGVTALPGLAIVERPESGPEMDA